MFGVGAKVAFNIDFHVESVKFHISSFVYISICL
jgi:hypothetical protein